MGKSNTQDTLKFVLDLLTLIPVAPRAIDAQTLTRQLHDRGHVRDARTVQRTLNEIQTQYPSLDCRDESRPYGWCWSAKALPITVPAMTLDQAIVLTLAKRVLPGAVPGSVERAIAPYFEAAHATLRREVNASKAAKWPKKVAFSSPAFALRPMQVKNSLMTTITQAIIEERWLAIRYRNASDFVTESRVKPLGLILEGPRSYLVAQFERFDAPTDPPRTLALLRIEMASVADETFAYPSDFSLDEFVALQPTGWGTGKQIRITLSLLPFLARILSESPMSEDQILSRGDDDDDNWRVEATVPESDRLLWWLLSFGAGVQVISPAKLRERVVKELRAAAKRYV